MVAGAKMRQVKQQPSRFSARKTVLVKPSVPYGNVQRPPSEQRNSRIGLVLYVQIDGHGPRNGLSHPSFISSNFCPLRCNLMITSRISLKQLSHVFFC